MSLALRLWLFVVLLAFGQVSLCAQLFLIGGQVPTTTLATSNLVTLGWIPSPDRNVVGYFLFWGRASGECTNQLDIGDVTSATLGGLETNITYYFCVVAYGGRGEKSQPSNETEFVLPDVPPAMAAPNLNFEVQNAGGIDVVLRLSFQGNPGAIYHLGATEDLQHWETLWITNCPPDGFVAHEVTGLADRPSRFFRLLQE